MVSHTNTPSLRTSHFRPSYPSLPSVLPITSVRPTSHFRPSHPSLPSVLASFSISCMRRYSRRVVQCLACDVMCLYSCTSVYLSPATENISLYEFICGCGCCYCFTIILVTISFTCLYIFKNRNITKKQIF